MTVKGYKRPITSMEGYFARSPYSIVAVVARIKGHVSKRSLVNAVSKVQQRHPNLRVRIEEDADHRPWFTSQGVLDRLIMNPGGAVPLATVNLVLGAVTCSGKLGLLLEYAEQAVDTSTMLRVQDRGMAFLLGE